MKTSKTFKMKS